LIIDTERVGSSAVGPPHDWPVARSTSAHDHHVEVGPVTMLAAFGVNGVGVSAAGVVGSAVAVGPPVVEPGPVLGPGPVAASGPAPALAMITTITVTTASRTLPPTRSAVTRGGGDLNTGVVPSRPFAKLTTPLWPPRRAANPLGDHGSIQV
jgi:hypothetical protein